MTPSFVAIVTLSGPFTGDRRVVHVIGPHGSHAKARAAGDEVAAATRMFAPVGASEEVDVTVHELVKDFPALVARIA